MDNQKPYKSMRDWQKRNGFNENQITYVVIGNSFLIKDDLKDAGFKYSSLLHWHIPHKRFKLPKGYCYRQLYFEDYFVWDEETHDCFLREGARKKLDQFFRVPAPTASRYQGEVGQRLTNIPARLTNASTFEDAFGFKWVYIFQDEMGNVYAWITSRLQPIAIGFRCILAGTVKNHAEYKSVPTTYLKNCHLAEL